MKIESILKKAGWESMPNSQGKPFKYYSSITADIVQGFKKEGKETIVVYGLNSAGYPPCLIRPLPKKVEAAAYINRSAPDPYAIDWEQRATEEEILTFFNELP